MRKVASQVASPAAVKAVAWPASAEPACRPAGCLSGWPARPCRWPARQPAGGLALSMRQGDQTVRVTVTRQTAKPVRSRLRLAEEHALGQKCRDAGARTQREVQRHRRQGDTKRTLSDRQRQRHGHTQKARDSQGARHEDADRQTRTETTSRHTRNRFMRHAPMCGGGRVPCILEVAPAWGPSSSSQTSKLRQGRRGGAGPRPDAQEASRAAGQPLRGAPPTPKPGAGRHAYPGVRQPLSPWVFEARECAKRRNRMRPFLTVTFQAFNAVSPASKYERLESNIGEGTYGKVGHRASIPW